MLKRGQTNNVQALVLNSGAPLASGTAAVSVWKNGTLDATLTASATSGATAINSLIWRVPLAIPTTYAKGDRVDVLVAITSGSVYYSALITEYVGTAREYQARSSARVADQFILPLSRRRDGTVAPTRSVYMQEGESIYVGLDVVNLYSPAAVVEAVGAPTVNVASELAADAVGPQGTRAVVLLDATAADSGDTYVVTCEITLDSGDVVSVPVTVEIA